MLPYPVGMVISGSEPVQQIDMSHGTNRVSFEACLLNLHTMVILEAQSVITDGSSARALRLFAWWQPAHKRDAVRRSGLFVKLFDHYAIPTADDL